MHKLIKSFTFAIFMALVLQRRVLVMGPRIILRGAIPIDSNIGGSGHRPFFMRGSGSMFGPCFSSLIFLTVFVVELLLLCFFSYVSLLSFIFLQILVQKSFFLSKICILSAAWY